MIWPQHQASMYFFLLLSIWYIMKDACERLPQCENTSRDESLHIFTVNIIVQLTHCFRSSCSYTAQFFFFFLYNQNFQLTINRVAEGESGAAVPTHSEVTEWPQTGKAWIGSNASASNEKLPGRITAHLQFSTDDRWTLTGRDLDSGKHFLHILREPPLCGNVVLFIQTSIYQV